MPGHDSNSKHRPHPKENHMLSKLSSHSLLAVTQSALRQLRPGARAKDVGTTLEAATVLRRHRTLWIARPLGLLVRCDSGTLWLVFDGDPADVVLEAGEEWVCRNDTTLSIHAMTSASVRLGRGLGQRWRVQPLSSVRGTSPGIAA
jgi:hypothetical protein